jgi:MYXO-CTERM domain-containing protein
MLALAFACLPALAQADSSGIQYEDAPPTATGQKPTVRHEPPAESSSASGGATAPSSQGGSASGGAGGSSSEDPSSESGGVASTGGNGGNGQGSPGTAADNPVAGGEQGISQGSPVETKSAAEDDGGSSPLVPILIAIAVLAAISLGALTMRQRRQRQGGSISPEAS